MRRKKSSEKGVVKGTFSGVVISILIHAEKILAPESPDADYHH
jgi:hypothetical protein